MKWMILSEKKLEQMIARRVEEARVVENADYEKEMLLKQANLQALQSQINPHFLYNTLECIRGMALLEDKENIADIAWSLSCFFRYSISGPSNVVTLRDELENCQTYARIQNYRFQDRFILHIEGGPEAYEAMLPKLTLQPMVENAILHRRGCAHHYLGQRLWHAAGTAGGTDAQDPQRRGRGGRRQAQRHRPAQCGPAGKAVFRPGIWPKGVQL